MKDSKIKVRILKQAGGAKISFSKGEVHTLDAKLAEDLLNAGYAEVVKETRQTATKKVKTEKAVEE